MAETLADVKNIAYEARRAFERGSIARYLLKSLYLEYNPSFLDIDNYLDFAERIFPKGNCGLATVYLKHVIGAGEVVEGQYIVEPHQFLTIGSLAVDITADQFGGPEVYVGPLDLPWSRREM